MSRSHPVRFQPYVNRYGDVVGVEALCPPQTRSLRRLRRHDRRVRTIACRQIADWQGQWPGLTLSVNAYPSELKDPRFADHVAKMLRRTGLSPELFRIEWIESEVLDLRDRRVRRNLARLLAYGVSITFDDVGSPAPDGSVGPVTVPAQLDSLFARGGFKLRELCTVIKLDRSLVIDDANRNRLAAFLHLAAERGLTVVAEGVEHLHHLVKLLVMQPGINLLVQGWLISKKLTAAEFVSWRDAQTTLA